MVKAPHSGDFAPETGATRQGERKCSRTFQLVRRRRTPQCRMNRSCGSRDSLKARHRRNIDLLRPASSSCEQPECGVSEKAQGWRAGSQQTAALHPKTRCQKRAPRRGQPALRGGAMAGTLSSSGSQSNGASTCRQQVWFDDKVAAGSATQTHAWKAVVTSPAPAVIPRLHALCSCK